MWSRVRLRRRDSGLSSRTGESPARSARAGEVRDKGTKGTGNFKNLNAYMTDYGRMQFDSDLVRELASYVRSRDPAEGREGEGDSVRPELTGKAGINRSGSSGERMLESIVLGSGLAFAAAIQPGPLTAFLLSQVAEKGWKRTLPAALAPLLSDGPVAILMLFVLTRLLAGMVPALQMAGGVLLLFLAGTTLSRLNQRGDAGQEENSTVPSSLFKATAVNLVNPGPYLGWGLILGPRALSAWKESPSLALGLVVSFYGTMVVTLATMIILFGAAESLGDRGRRRLVVVSALTLAGLGIFQFWNGLAQLFHW